MAIFINQFELQKTFLFLNQMGQLKSKTLINAIGALVIKNDNNKEKRDNYMRQLKRLHYCFVEMYGKQPL